MIALNLDSELTYDEDFVECRVTGCHRDAPNIDPVEGVNAVDVWLCNEHWDQWDIQRASLAQVSRPSEAAELTHRAGDEGA